MGYIVKNETFNGVGRAHTIYVFLLGFILGLVFFLGQGIFIAKVRECGPSHNRRVSHFSQLSTLLALGHTLRCFGMLPVW